ncbi:DNA/RNA non-specific endonuclease [Saccharicrinis aurantiacus]|uniref:DNA/RNA non-specific endonuclease n=1 Tax=Saccharicrinis aurantiacus TaxID=1849719 RepID=UPI00094FA6C0|nr:DNA/RNA non-specific endonuclease [Saccharicrinis aurantiacus]
MPLKKYILSITLSLSSLLVFAQYQPTINGELVEHAYYSLSYIEDHEQAEWVYYTINAGNAKRTDDFRPDPKVSTSSASLEDYKGSGYDRGHLCPAAAMKVNHTAMSQTFYMSNMSPQKPNFNRGIWKNLEALVREWGWSTETHVVTGPIFKDNMGAIGSNKVTVPGSYYKVIYQPSSQLMIGFVLPNEKSEKALSEFILPVDSIESLTGINFFSQVDDQLEAKLESQKGNINDWSRTSTKSAPNNVKPAVSSNQCKGTAKSTGHRCKSKTNNANGYCRHHQNQS